MAGITTDVQTAAEWISTALSSSGYVADFSPASLWEVDRFFDEHSRNGKPVSGGLLSTDLGSRIFAVGSYVGEVVRRSAGGEWRGDDTDPAAELDVELVVGDSVCWPMERVMKRFTNGAEDSLAAYGAGLGLEVGPKPEKPAGRRPWWKLW